MIKEIRRERNLRFRQDSRPKYLKADQNDLKEVLSGHHRFSLRIGRAPWQQFDFVVDSKDIFVMPQPLGALVSALVGKDGKQLATAAKIFSKNTIVFDPGFEPVMITLSIMVVLSMKTHSRILGCGRSFKNM